MKFNLNNIIGHPEDKAPLRYDSTANQFVYESQHDEIIFDIINSIPIMVKSSVPKVTSSAHTAHKSVFDYVDHYEKDSEAFDYFQIPDDSATIHENRRLHEFILSKVDSNADSILDVGCGNGWVARHFSKKNKNIVSFDISLDNIERVLKESPSPNHYGVKGDVLALPFIDESFDLVISAEVIEHVPNTALYIANIVRALNKGGRAIISTPYNEKLQYSLCIHCNRSTPLHAHIHSFKEDSLDALVRTIPGLTIAAFTMSNKGLLFLRTHKVLKYLPFSLWRFIDSFMNKIIKKPSRLVYVLDKTK